jgi:hypothetical protein
MIITMDTVTTVLQTLQKSVGELETAEKNLIYGPNQTNGLKQLIEFLQPHSDKENIKTALPILQQGLQELQQAPTEFINSILIDAKTKGSSGLSEAVSLVKNYFRVTKSLDSTLPQLKDTLNGLSQKIDNVTIQPNPKTVALIVSQSISPLGVVELRSALLTALGSSEVELNFSNFQLSEGEEIKFLRRSSNDVLTVLKDTTLSVFQRVAQFVDHLEGAREILKTLNRKGVSWGGSETDDVQEILTNWEAATKKVAELETSASPSDVQLNRQSIAESIQIHDLLEVNYDYLSALVRSGDLVDPGNL